jgi:hypothetical protein
MTTKEDAKKPIRGVSVDGIYRRCVMCDIENYGPAVSEYSRGNVPCYLCGELLPKSHIKLNNREGVSV